MRSKSTAGPYSSLVTGDAAVGNDGVVGEDRILTVPNVITVVRLLCVPIFLWLLFDQHKRAEAAFFLGALGATDFADGYIARHFNQVSTVGKILDPTADRILLIVGVSAILIDGAGEIQMPLLGAVHVGQSTIEESRRRHALAERIVSQAASAVCFFDTAVEDGASCRP